MAKSNSGETLKNGQVKKQPIMSTSARWVLVAFIVSMIAVGIQVYQKKGLSSVSSDEFGRLPAQVEPGSENFTGKEPQEDGGENGRRLPDVDFMPSSARQSKEVRDPSTIPGITWLSGAPMKDRRERAMGVRFKNFYPFDLTMWWDDGTEEGVYSGGVRSLGDSSTNTYTTHVFHFRRKDTGETVASFEMTEGEHIIFLGPDENDTEMLESPLYKEALKERTFMQEYYRKNGIPWLSSYPRDKPILKIWPCDFVGQTHRVRSYIGYFNSATEQSPDPIDLTIRVVSTSPRVIVIENLLSPFEIEHIMSMGMKTLRRSSVGSSYDGFQSKTRTSSNGWLSRHKSDILNTIYYRFADVLLMTDAQMTEGPEGNIEQLQFVEYKETQEYQNHHDFGASEGGQRFSTLLIYLRTPEEGGATSFPKAFDGRGIKVKPPPGSAALFYSMLEDGNGDDLSLHAGMPVGHGSVKYVCNLWSWDPKYGH